MGKKRRQTAATVRDAMTVQYHLMRQREQYHETRDEVRAAYAKGAADMCQRAVRLVGEHLGPAPMPPPTSRRATATARPSSGRATTRTTGGSGTTFRRSLPTASGGAPQGTGRPAARTTATRPVLSIDRQKREHDRTLRRTH